MMASIHELNDMSRERFVDALGAVFEHSPWVAEHAWEARPFRSVQHLHAVMMQKVTESSAGTILSLFRAHPDLATRMKVTGFSAGEQQGAGLDRLSPEESEYFASLNQTYVGKFGFPFILAVAGKTREQIVSEMERRTASDPASEWGRALAEIARISEIRLTGMIQNQSSCRKGEPPC